MSVSVPVGGGVDLTLDINRARRLHRRLGRALEPGERADGVRPAVLVLNGPIGSGKSTVAAHVAGQQRAAGVLAVVCGLDEIVAMVHTPEGVHNDLAWDHAREAHAALVAAFIASGAERVTAEGGFFNRHERDFLQRALEPVADLRWVTLTVSYEVALRRVSNDPRRRSKDPAFLRTTHDHFHDSMKALAPNDLWIDTTDVDIATICARLAH